VLEARGWKPHFSSTASFTRSGVVMGVKPRAAALAIAQLTSASSSSAAALRR